MVSRREVIETARKYVGYPYRTQGRDALGLDCGGLLLVVGRELHLTDLEVLGYSQNPDGASFERHLRSVLTEISRSETMSADIIACDYGDGLQHTAFVTTLLPKLTIIHAKRNAGVIEQYIHGRDLRGWVKSYRIRGIID